MSIFTRLSAAVVAFNQNTEVDLNVVRVLRAKNPVEVRPGMTALDAALEANHLDDGQESVATFEIENIDGTKEFVDENYICQGGQTLIVSVNRDSKG